MSDSAGPVLLRGHEAPLSAVAFSADSRRLATGGQDGEIRLWDLTSATATAALPVTFAKGADLCSYGCTLITTADTGWVISPYIHDEVQGIGFWEVAPQARSEPSFLCQREAEFSGFSALIDMAYHAGSGLLAVRYSQSDLDIFDVDIARRTCMHRRTLGAFELPWPDTAALGFSPDGRWLILKNVWNESTQLWDMTSGEDAEVIICSGAAPRPEDQWRAVCCFAAAC